MLVLLWLLLDDTGDEGASTAVYLAGIAETAAAADLEQALDDAAVSLGRITMDLSGSWHRVRSHLSTRWIEDKLCLFVMDRSFAISVGRAGKEWERESSAHDRSQG